MVAENKYENSYVAHIGNLSSNLFGDNIADYILMKSSQEEHFFRASPQEYLTRGQEIKITDSVGQTKGNEYVMSIVDKLKSTKGSKAAQQLNEFLNQNDFEVVIKPSFAVDGSGEY